MMKTIKITIAIAAILWGMSSTVTAQQESFTLKVEVTGLENSAGKVLIELLDKNQSTVSDAEVTITSNKAVVEFKNLQPGIYAVQYFHDKNNNGVLDKGTFGIPLEGYGFSNDARGFMGPPDFEDELFNLDQDLTIVLSTKN